MKQVHAFVFLALALGLAACAGGGSSGPTGSDATPTPTSVMAGGEGSSATLVYEYLLTSADQLYETRVSEQLPIFVFVDPIEPRAATIVSGGGEGAERVRIQGMNAGVACWVELNYVVRYDVIGEFDPKDNCRFTLRVRAIPDHTRTTGGGDCPPGAAGLISPEMLFIAPYEGPFEFTTPYRTIEIDFGGGARVRAELRDLRLPSATGCP